jgi:hypothetical protein
MILVPIGSKVVIQGIGAGVVMGYRPGRSGWSHAMYYWVQMRQFGGQLHLFSHLEVVTGRLLSDSNVGDKEARS